MGKYDDIINLPHHVSPFRQQMSIENRAAQFAPFAALTGHEEAIAETARVTQKMLYLTEYEKQAISRNLQYSLAKRKKIRISYFCKDALKSGGSYSSVTGIISKIDEYEKTVFIENTLKIHISNITDASFPD